MTRDHINRANNVDRLDLDALIDQADAQFAELSDTERDRLRQDAEQAERDRQEGEASWVDRGQEDERGDDDGFDSAASRPAVGSGSPEVRGQSDGVAFGRRTLLCVDAASYSARTDVQQHELQRALVGVIDAAVAAAGLDRSRLSAQSTGDGELAVVPAEVPEWTVIDRFPQALNEALAKHNEGRGAQMRIRMRLAIHHGFVSPAARGFAGQGVVTVSRLVNSDVARHALMACPAADLVVLVSSSLFNDVVRQGHTNLSPTDLRQVMVRNKTFDDPAWLWVPGHDAHTLHLDDPPPDDDKMRWRRMAT